MTKYPGLGLPLKLNYEDVLGHYPIGIHSTCDDSLSGLITVREVAMMNVMDRLMDKPDWHKKVFNDEIISKWRREALEIPDDYFWTEATWGKEESWLETPIHELSNFSEKKPLEGILSPEAFDYVSDNILQPPYLYSKYIPTLIHLCSASRNSGTRPATTNPLAWSAPSRHMLPSSNPTLSYRLG